MVSRSLRIVLLGGSAAALLALGGCVVYPNQAYYGGAPGYGYPGEVVVAPSAPPPLIAESYGVAPAPGYLWLGGYWGWNGGRHVWTPGRWEAPRPGYRWVPRTWEQGRGGWHQRGGHWERH